MADYEALLEESKSLLEVAKAAGLNIDGSLQGRMAAAIAELVQERDRLRSLVMRAQYNTPEFYASWHVEARSVLGGGARPDPTSAEAPVEDERKSAFIIVGDTQYAAGLMHAVLPGRGIGPIVLGGQAKTTMQVIEDLLDLPCKLEPEVVRARAPDRISSLQNGRRHIKKKGKR